MSVGVGVSGMRVNRRYIDTDEHRSLSLVAASGEEDVVGIEMSRSGTADGVESTAHSFVEHY